MKNCSICSQEKSETEFFYRKSGKNGKLYASPYCKVCEREKAKTAKKLRYDDPVKGQAMKRKSRERTSTDEYKLARSVALREKYATDEDYRQLVLDGMRVRREDSQEHAKIRARAAAYYQNNKSKIQRKVKIRHSSNPRLKIRGYMRGRVNEAMKKVGKSKGGTSSLQYLPYSWDDLYRHLESQFEDWMNFSNYGAFDPDRRTWQIDHIIPQAFFPYESMDSELFRMCWDLRNLRPYDSSRNFAEGDRHHLLGAVCDIRELFQSLRNGYGSIRPKELPDQIWTRILQVAPVTGS